MINLRFSGPDIFFQEKRRTRHKRWVIYSRKTRNVISPAYARRKSAVRDLRRLNGQGGPGQYCLQLRVFDQDSILISQYPDIKLNELRRGNGGDYTTG